MPKVTSKLQLTVPKAVADQYGIRPGDDLEWVPAGETIRVIPPGKTAKSAQNLGLNERLDLFDKASERQRQREKAVCSGGANSVQKSDRGWKREDLYARGLSR